MKEELDPRTGKRAENESLLKRFSPMQVALTGLIGAVILVILVLAISLAVRLG